MKTYICTVTWLVSTAVLLYGVGCSRKADPQDVRSERHCRQLAEASDSSPYTREIARTILGSEKWKDPDVAPIILQAHLHQRKDGSDSMLILYVLRTANINGFSIRETRAGTRGSDDSVLEEDYSSVPRHRSERTGVYPMLTSVRIRNNNQRKDEDAWAAYLARGNRKEGCPEIWMSIPDPNGPEVQISVRDATGRRSDWCPVELRIDEDGNKGIIEDGAGAEYGDAAR